MAHWRLIPLYQGPGPLQMAIDHWLFDQCHAGLHPPTLRFYTWSPAAISLGHHQKQYPPHWHTLQWQNCPLDLVRRPTGGRAVLHAGDLTYSLVLSHQTGNRRQTYDHICGFLIRGWRSLGLELAYGQAVRGYQGQSNCFATATAADLVGPQGEKLIGSAQLWRGQTVLQHGSMQLNPNPRLWQQVFGTDADSGDPKELAFALHTSIPPQEIVIQRLTETAQMYFGIDFAIQPLTPMEWKAIETYLPGSYIPTCTSIYKSKAQE